MWMVIDDLLWFSTIEINKLPPYLKVSTESTIICMYKNITDSIIQKIINVM